jgi:excisionase family DNA binding protein
MTDNLLETLLTDIEVARIRNQSVATIRRERLHNTGIRFYRVGGSIRYRREDVKAWLDSLPTGGGDLEAR